MYAKLPPPPEKDADGFVKSFSCDDVEGIKEFYETYGFVVIANAISDEEADAAYSEIWDYLEGRSSEVREIDVINNNKKSSSWTGFLKRKPVIPPSVQRDDVNTWLDYWPGRDGGRGIIGDGVVKGPAAWKNRQSESLYKGFVSVLGTEELTVSCDRYGFMRPTKNIQFKDGPLDKDKWRTEEAWVHWDLNPHYWTGVEKTPEHGVHLINGYKVKNQGVLITENNDVVDFKGFDKVQGLVALQDSREEDGGFCCVPGFQQIIKEWAESRKIYCRAHFVFVENDEEIENRLTKIPIRKGSCVIWSSCLPHCNYPNYSDKVRACQYIKMFPTSVLPEEVRKYRNEFIKDILPESFELSPTGKKVLLVPE